MKKTFFAVSGLIILAFFILVAVNAQDTDMKASRENTTEINKSVTDRACCNLTGNKMANCCSDRCSGMNCVSKCKEGKCDLATCKNCKSDASCTGKCGSYTCMSNCNKSNLSVITGPMNCAKDLAVAAE